jgi:hypothetical protein
MFSGTVRGPLQAVRELTGLVESANTLLHGSKGLETKYLQLPSYASQRLSLALEDDPGATAYMAPLRCLSHHGLTDIPLSDHNLTEDPLSANSQTGVCIGNVSFNFLSYRKGYSE